MSTPLRVSCLCGAVSFEIEGKIGPAGQCHCSKCRKVSGTDGNAVFSIDQPSAAFGSLGIADVTKVGEGLDRKVANLLRVIGVEADQAFT